MAAQEYFNMSQPNGNSQSQGIPPAPRPQVATNSSAQSGPNPPYPLYDGPPPPYSPGGLRTDGPPTPQGRPQSQTTSVPEKQSAQHRLSQQFQAPQQRVQPRPATNGSSNGHVARPSLSQSQQEYDSQFRPPVRQQHSYYPPEKQSYPQTGPPYAQQQQPQQPQYYGSSLPVQPPYQNGYGDRKGHSVSFAPGRPQERYPSRTRSESRSRSRSRERTARSTQRNKKSSGLNTFLGAGGGAILGDAIFPGLGTIGGALLGGFGGHEYDKNKKRARSHEVRPRDRRYSDEYDHRPSRR